MRSPMRVRIPDIIAVIAGSGIVVTSVASRTTTKIMDEFDDGFLDTKGRLLDGIDRAIASARFRLNDVQYTAFLKEALNRVRLTVVADQLEKK
jgi:hypothetical protein